MNNPQRPTDAGCVEQCDFELAEAIVGAANIVSHDGYYEVDIDKAALEIARHRLETLSASGGDAAELAAADMRERAVAEAVRDLLSVAQDAVKALPVLITMLESARLPAGQIVGEGMLAHARAAIAKALPLAKQEQS